MAYDADPGGSQSTAAMASVNALGPAAGDVGWARGGGFSPNPGGALARGDVGWTQGGGEPVNSAPARGATQTQPQAPTVSTSDQMLKAGILKHISTSEGATYNTLYGGGTFNDYSKFPAWGGSTDTPTGDPTHAAGAYQFQPGTWAGQASQLGLKDFSPESQDAGAFNLASTEYKSKTGHDIMDDARSGSVNWNALGGQWSSLRGQKPSGVGGSSQPTSTGQSQSRAQTSDAGPSDQGQTQALSMDSMNALLAYQAAYPGLNFTAVNENPFGGESKNG